ncbi:Hypothetical protein PENO1_044140 [Penicillium occitanis (nom. inval.)]|nr:hypothetical protein PENOC_057120 [Penicillium occitanis (nom. inval.)]PCH01192.1 Hypothetical protein PENO1_044140 [Penicillium occitanis (nom. inval.)]
MYFHIGLSAPWERGDQSELVDLMAAVRDRDADNVVVDVQLSHSETHYRMVPMTSSERIRRRQRQRQLQVATLFFPVDDDRNPLQDLPPNLRYQEIQASDGGAVSFDGMLLFVGERPCASIVGQIYYENEKPAQHHDHDYDGKCQDEMLHPRIQARQGMTGAPIRQSLAGCL